MPKKRKRLRKIWCKRHSVSGAEVSQRRDEIEQLFFPFLFFSLSFASLFHLKDFSCGKCEMSFQLRCSPKPENTVNDFIHNNIEYNRIPTSSSRTRYTQTNHHPSHPFPADTSGCPSAFRTVRYSSLLAGCDDLRIDCADILLVTLLTVVSNRKSTQLQSNMKIMRSRNLFESILIMQISFLFEATSFSFLSIQIHSGAHRIDLSQ